MRVMKPQAREPLSTAQCIDLNNRLEFEDFVDGRSFEEFMDWVYRNYGISKEEKAAIEAAYERDGVVCIEIFNPMGDFNE